MQDTQESRTSLKDMDKFQASAAERMFEGQVSAKGRAAGYHDEGAGETAGKVIPGTESSENGDGVYRAQVEARGIPKTANGGFSTFFPKTTLLVTVTNSPCTLYGKGIKWTIRKHISASPAKRPRDGRILHGNRSYSKDSIRYGLRLFRMLFFVSYEQRPARPPSSVDGHKKGERHEN